MTKQKQISLQLLIALIVSLISAYAVPIFIKQARAESLNLSTYVDPFIGTKGSGHTYPAAQAPFGMMQLGPDTSHRKGGSGYDIEDTYIESFSLTHLSGVGCDAASDLPFIPVVSSLSESPVLNKSVYRQQKANEAASPGYYKTDLVSSGIRVELAATSRAGLSMFQFPASGNSSVLMVPSNSTKAVDDSSLIIDPDKRSISGWAKSGGFCNSSNRYIVYFHAEFDTSFTAFGTWEGSARSDGSRKADGMGAATYVQFDTTSSKLVMMKVGLSFVSVSNAENNAKVEIPGWDLSKVKTGTEEAWNGLLNKIKVTGGTTEQKKMFYTSIYHTSMQPSIFNDVNGEYIGFDDQIHTVENGHNMYSTFSMWDTYRTQPQLLAWIAPQAASDMVKSLLLNAEQATDKGGGLPGWGYYNDDPNIMGTYPAPLFIANAFAFGAKEFDTAQVKNKLIETATSTDPLKKASTKDTSGAAWWGLEHYMRDGYVDSVSATLEYSLTDFAISMFSKSLGDDPNYRYFRNRSQQVFNLFNPDATTDGGYLQRKDADGNWIVPFSPTSADGFLEGNSAQYSWGIPHNVEGIIGRMGGNEAFGNRLQQHLSHYEKEGWPTDSPYWWSGNEPGMGVPFLYNWVRKPWATQEKVWDILHKQWDATSAGLPGNDDTGTASAWFVWCALGLYPEIPGVGGFTLFSPLFPKAEIFLDDGKIITIQAENTGESHPYIQRMAIDGIANTSTWVTMNRLTAREGAKLEYVLGDSPSDWGTGEMDVPPSYGTISSSTLTNVAANRPAEASGTCKASEISNFAVDGNSWTKWCHNSAEDKWLKIDLGGQYAISRWRVEHSGVAEDPAYNTRDFMLQVSLDGLEWTDADTVSGNSEAITDRTFKETQAAYVRLYITGPTQTNDSAARIYELEVFGK